MGVPPASSYQNGMPGKGQSSFVKSPSWTATFWVFGSFEAILTRLIRGQRIGLRALPMDPRDFRRYEAAYLFRLQRYHSARSGGPGCHAAIPGGNFRKSFKRAPDRAQGARIIG